MLVAAAVGSFLIGTLGLDVAALVALGLAIVRRPRGDLGSLAPWLHVALAAQLGHFVEELATGFRVAFPVAFGLDAWPVGVFVAFNVAWLIVWAAAAPLLRRGFRAALFPVWFLALAAVANGVVHPLLALRAGGYFPGLATSPLVAVAGVALWRRAWKLTAGS